MLFGVVSLLLRPVTRENATAYPLFCVWDASRQGDNGEWNYLEAIAAKAVEMIRVIDW